MKTPHFVFFAKVTEGVLCEALAKVNAVLERKAGLTGDHLLCAVKNNSTPHLQAFIGLFRCTHKRVH